MRLGPVAIGLPAPGPAVPPEHLGTRFGEPLSQWQLVQETVCIKNKIIGMYFVNTKIYICSEITLLENIRLPNSLPVSNVSLMCDSLTQQQGCLFCTLLLRTSTNSPQMRWQFTALLFILLPLSSLAATLGQTLTVVSLLTSSDNRCFNTVSASVHKAKYVLESDFSVFFIRYFIIWSLFSNLICYYNNAITLSNKTVV